MSELKHLLENYKQACLEVGYFGTGERLARAEKAIEDYIEDMLRQSAQK